jgi:hypothetical protein
MRYFAAAILARDAAASHRRVVDAPAKTGYEMLRRRGRTMPGTAESASDG